MRPKNRHQLYSSHTITADENSAVQKCRHRGMILDIIVTAVTDTPSVVFTIQSKDYPDGTTYTNLLLSAAVTGTGTTRLIIYPGCVAVANSILNQPMPMYWRLFSDGTWGGTDGITYQVYVTQLD